jgi:hypothetical protein
MTSGFYWLFLRWKRLDDSCEAADTKVTMSIYPNPKGDCLAYITLEFKNSNSNVNYTLYDGNDNAIGDSHSIDSTSYYIVIEMKIGLSYTQSSGNRDYIYWAVMEKIDISGGLVTELEETSTTGGNSDSYSLKNRLYHDVRADWWVGSIADGDFDMHAEIRAVGIRPDVSYEDAKVDMRDVGLMASNFDADIVDEDWWSGTAWKCDIDADDDVDMVDITYVAGLFGKEY